MFKLFGQKKATDPARREEGSCPTRPCPTCQAPMPVAGFDQRCMRCQALVPAAKTCPGACSGCEMGS